VKVCYFGTYDADYARNRILIQSLRSCGVEVVECRSDLWHGTADKVAQARKGLVNPRLWRRLAKAYVQLLCRYLKAGRWDAMVVGYAGHLDVFLARILTWLTRKPLVFDAFLSLHETLVDDRGLAHKKSLLASLAFHLEKVGCALSDMVLLDTQTQARYFVQKYALPRQKFEHIWVGADESVYHPMPTRQEDATFRIIYFGKFVPLHGVEWIIRAAGDLADQPDIRFEFIGGGQTYGAARRLARELAVPNITWGPEWLDPPELAQRISRADVCLGIFGISAKAARVIPSKAYIALAMRKPLITRDSPAAREVLVSGENALLCPAGDAGALADCILALRDDPALRERIAGNGHRLFQEAFSSEAIGAQMKRVLEQALDLRNRRGRR